MEPTAVQSRWRTIPRVIAREAFSYLIHVSGVIIASLAFVAIRWLLDRSWPTLIRAWNTATQSTTDSWPLIIVGVSVLAVARLLYKLREARRDLYAYIEIAIAALAAAESYARFLPIGSFGALTFSLAACVYIGVRGFDNLAIATKAREAKKTETNAA